jgi:hypothetical protein
LESNFKKIVNQLALTDATPAVAKIPVFLA